MINFDSIENPTIKDAEQYFKMMGCSSFHMSREYPAFYDKYLNMKITEKVENRWRQESIIEHEEAIKELKPSEQLWSLHSQMADLIGSAETIENLNLILNVTKYLESHSAKKTNILIGETIIGRSALRYKSGLIFMANKYNREMAIEFVKLARHFTKIENNTKDNLERCIDADEKLKLIIRKEKLS
jgi:hypothetical protein